jgi:hypothetical protein
VGTSTKGAATSLVEHWDGTSWSVVRTPELKVSSQFLGVSAVSSSDVWTGGYYTTPEAATLAEHWDGARWSHVSSPNPGKHGGLFNGISAVAGDDAWAAGSASGQTLTERWDGRIWSTVPSPSQGDQTNILYAVSGSSSSNAWAAGFYYLVGAVAQTLILRWDGAAWSIDSSPNLGSSSTLNGVAALSDSEGWAVGTWSDAYIHPLAEHFC